MTEKTFEQAMNELEEIVKRLESGTTNLEESIELYKKGLDLYSFCFNKLKEAEKLVVKISDDKVGEDNNA
ncbi:MAG: exodeoxyribonuclease VII small subunit [Bacilli bacterium]|nr:exodeoxyribonuclease VII small subunit [Bacilli bacterium]